MSFANEELGHDRVTPLNFRHMVLSFIENFKDPIHRENLIFPSAIVHVLLHHHVAFPPNPYFIPHGALGKDTISRSSAELSASRTNR